MKRMNFMFIQLNPRMKTKKFLKMNLKKMMKTMLKNNQSPYLKLQQTGLIKRIKKMFKTAQLKPMKLRKHKQKVEDHGGNSSLNHQ